MVHPRTGNPTHWDGADHLFGLTDDDLSFADRSAVALGSDPGLWLADDNSFSLLVGDDAASGAQNSAAAWSYYSGLSKPAALPQSSDSDRGSLVTAQTVALVEDYGSGLPQSGADAVNLFAQGKPGGGGGGGGGVPQPYSYTNNGITLGINWDSSVGSAPSGFVSGFKTAVNSLLNTLGPAIGSNSITITLAVGWGETGGSKLSPFALGQSLTYIERHSYADLQGSAMGTYLPADPTGGTGNYWVPTAEEKALGLPVQDLTLTIDGAVGFGSRFSWNFNGSPGSGQYDFIAVAKHEISEAMGRIALLGATVGGVANSYTPFDLFRFTDVGTPSLTGGADAYFSFDGGNSSTGSGSSNRTYFNTQAGGDWGDWQSSGAHSAGADAYNAFASTGVAYSTGTVDQLAMDAIGYGKLPTIV